MKIVLATANKGKVKELAGMLEDGRITVLSLDDFPGFPDIEETGGTFAENALLKARAACVRTKLIALADDSGLEVDALNGAPGIYSARYAGEPKDDGRNIVKLLAELKDIPDEARTARFRCCLAIAVPGGEEMIVEGSVEGRILRAPKGSGGFGYDPVFYLPAYGRTMAELTLEEKNRISHRAQALQTAVPLLKQMLSQENR